MRFIDCMRRKGEYKYNIVRAKSVSLKHLCIRSYFDLVATLEKTDTDFQPDWINIL